jgi:photosystem II stability/assembly factor-like uncharacterized protein
MAIMLVCSLLLTLPLTAQAGKWTVQKTGMCLGFFGVDFVNNREGWAIGLDASKAAQIYKTSDGGITWRNQHLAGDMVFGLGVDMVDSKAGYLSGGGFGWVFGGGSMTKNGGTNWKAVLRGYGFITAQSLSAVDANHVWLAGDWSKDRITGSGVITSSDGGTTWTEYNWGVDTGARYVHFISENEGWLSGGMWPSEETSTSGAGQATYAISQHLSIPVMSEVPKASFHQGTSVAADTYRAAIAHTIDGGKTWEVQFNDSGNFYLNGIYFVNANKGWAVGEGDLSAYVLGTVDGGKTWNVIYTSPTDTVYSLMQIEMVNESKGWAVGMKKSNVGAKPYIIHTEDGGKSWLEEEVVRSNAAIMDLSFVNENEGWAVGSNTGSATVLHYK